MKVKELMSKKVFTTGLDENVDRIFFLFHYEGIRHIPVIDKDKVVGVISDRDLKKILGPKPSKKEIAKEGGVYSIRSRKVRTIMTRGLVTIGPEEKASDAAAIMAKRKIGCLPVLQNSRLVGIITATDILRAFVRLSNEIQKIHKQLAKVSVVQ